MRAIHAVTAALLASVATLTVAQAHAQATATGFALDQFSPSERGSEWFSEDSLDLRGDPGAAIGVVGELAIRPLVIYNPDGSTRAVPVRDQLILHPGASVTLFSRLRLGLDVPVAVYQAGTSGVVDGVAYPAVTSGGVGDLRVGADLRLFGHYGGPISVALGVQLFVPSGNSAQYLGDNSFHAVLPRVLVAGQLGWFAYAAHLGFHYRGLDTTFAGATVGSDVIFGASAGVRAVEGKLVFGPELYGSTGVQGGAFDVQTTPVELLLGAHYLIGSSVRVGGGVAPGLTRAYGEPAVRFLAGLEWVSSPPAPAPPDRDHDGILDADDACPDVPGVKTDDPKTNGCPPDPDRDKDGIPNEEDACPDAAGPRNANPKKNGCPAAAVVGKQIVILEQVKFATGSAAILPASNGILTAVLDVLQTHAEIHHLRVEGHTDNVGTAVFNRGLSTKRAASVANWLIQHGVDSSRMASEGFGLERPIDTNETPEGRQNNRRVEFHIDDEVTK
jgi:OmpA-OmpF porin, OOP family